jgi:hypothetical protein
MYNIAFLRLSLVFGSSGFVKILYHCIIINTIIASIVNHITQLMICAIRGIEPNSIIGFHCSSIRAGSDETDNPLGHTDIHHFLSTES